MNGAPYQYCQGCKEEKNFKWDEFKLECTTCGWSYTPTVKEPVQFSAMKLEGVKNTHLSFKRAEELFDQIVHKTVERVVEKIKEKPIDVRNGVQTQLPPEGRNVKALPLEIRTPPDFEGAINLKLFLGGDSDDDIHFQ